MQRIQAAMPSAAAEFAQIGVQVEYFGVTATCSSSGECECDPNYLPPLCETKALCTNNCTSNGECVDGSMGRVCSCNDGYTGRDCSTLNCLNACSEHGSCNLQSGAAPVCQCESGWTGDACNTCMFAFFFLVTCHWCFSHFPAAACPNNCTGYGTCDAGYCTCQAGRTGDDCGTASMLLWCNFTRAC